MLLHNQNCQLVWHSKTYETDSSYGLKVNDIEKSEELFDIQLYFWIGRKKSFPLKLCQQLNQKSQLKLQTNVHSAMYFYEIITCFEN